MFEKFWEGIGFKYKEWFIRFCYAYSLGCATLVFIEVYTL